MSNYMHDKLQEGDTVLLAPPCGTFMSPGASEGAVVFTAGVGITPAWALVQTYGDDVIKAAVHVDQTPVRDAFRDRFKAAGVEAQVGLFAYNTAPLVKISPFLVFHVPNLSYKHQSVQSLP